MSTGDFFQQKKMNAIYGLRQAAEAKAVAEVTADRNPSAPNRDALLDATLNLESKTQDAIEACHECGQPHAPGVPHPPYHENVFDITTGQKKKPGDKPKR